MRMLRDSSRLAGGGVEQGSSVAPATAPPLDTPLSAWDVAATQGQLTPDGRISSSSTRLVDAGFGKYSDAPGVILAALLCALVGALSLISLLRCALHYCGRRSSALPPAAGLKQRVLRRMPVAVYEAAAEGGGAECAICLGEFEDGDAVRLLPRCRHGFHVHCIDTWLSAHSSCPICRDSLLDESATAAAAGEDTTTGWMSREFAAAMLILP